jgi:hypothetical protein
MLQTFGALRIRRREQRLKYDRETSELQAGTVAHYLALQSLKEATTMPSGQNPVAVPLKTAILIRPARRAKTV